MKTEKSLKSRIIFDLAILLLAIFGPWWITLTAALVGAIFFGNYFELIILSFWIDCVVWDGAPWGFPFLFSISGFILFLVLGKTRAYLKF